MPGLGSSRWLFLTRKSSSFFFGSHAYAKVVVFSKIPLPNYRFDLDDKRPLREVIISTLLLTHRLLELYNRLVFFLWFLRKVKKKKNKIDR